MFGELSTVFELFSGIWFSAALGLGISVAVIIASVVFGLAFLQRRTGEPIAAVSAALSEVLLAVFQRRTRRRRPRGEADAALSTVTVSGRANAGARREPHEEPPDAAIRDDVHRPFHTDEPVKHPGEHRATSTR